MLNKKTKKNKITVKCFFCCWNNLKTKQTNINRYSTGSLTKEGGAYMLISELLLEHANTKWHLVTPLLYPWPYTHTRSKVPSSLPPGHLSVPQNQSVISLEGRYARDLGGPWSLAGEGQWRGAWGSSGCIMGDITVCGILRDCPCHSVGQRGDLTWHSAPLCHLPATLCAGWRQGRGRKAMSVPTVSRKGWEGYFISFCGPIYSVCPNLIFSISSHHSALHALCYLPLYPLHTMPPWRRWIPLSLLHSICSDGSLWCRLGQWVGGSGDCLDEPVLAVAGHSLALVCLGWVCPEVFLQN